MKITDRPSDLRGHGGEAWLLPSDAGSLARYYVRAPGRHPFWEWWLVSVVHLQPAPGLRPAHKQYPLAEYEFSIITMDPRACPPDDDRFTILTPLDVVFQFDGVTPQDATRMAQAGVIAILNNRLSPDSDHRPLWIRALRSMVSGFKSGKCPTN